MRYCNECSWEETGLLSFLNNIKRYGFYMQETANTWLMGITVATDGGSESVQ